MSLISALAGSQYLIVNKTLIQKLGLAEAVILSELCSEYDFWKREGKLQDGMFFCTAEKLEQKTTIKVKKQRGLIKKMADMNILQVEVKGMPATRYFSINETVLSMLIDSENQCQAEDCNEDENDAELEDNQKNGILGVTETQSLSQYSQKYQLSMVKTTRLYWSNPPSIYIAYNNTYINKLKKEYNKLYSLAIFNPIFLNKGILNIEVTAECFNEKGIMINPDDYTINIEETDKLVNQYASTLSIGRVFNKTPLKEKEKEKVPPKEREKEKKENASPKPNRYTRCTEKTAEYLSKIEKDSVYYPQLETALRDYLNYRFDIKDKPLYPNQWKGLLNNLDSNGTSIREKLDIVLQALRRGYMGFYPVSHTNNRLVTENASNWHVVSQRATSEEMEESRRLDYEREQKGVKTRF